MGQDNGRIPAPADVTGNNVMVISQSDNISANKHTTAQCRDVTE